MKRTTRGRKQSHQASAVTLRQGKFQFDSAETLCGGFARVCDELIRKALALIACPSRNRAEDLHQVRVSIKRLRALLRLARSMISKKIFERENARLRKAADRLSVFRDPTVSRQILEKMIKRLSDEDSRTAFRAVLAAFVRERPRQAQFRTEREEVMREAGRSLKRTGLAFQSLLILADEWSAIEKGLKIVYRAARNRMLRALATGSDEEFHNWRKQTKYLYYQLQTIEPVWPKRLGRTIKRLRKLEDQLGVDHDLSVLKRLLIASPEKYGGTGAVERVVACLDEQSGILREECESSGQKLFSEKPRKFARKLAHHWSAWRKKCKAQDNI
jgi:CHAD domain-containing protein